MYKKYKYLVLFSIAVSFLFFYLVTYNVEDIRNKKDYYNISVINRHTNSRSFEIMMQGMEQASNDMKADITYISLTEYNNVEEQNQLLKREYDNGVDAILISAADSDYLVPTVNEISIKIPVISIESNVNTQNITAFYSADNYKMGEVLGKRILSEITNEDKNILILQGSINSYSLCEREKGIIDILSKNGIIVNTIPFIGVDTSKPYFFENLIFEYNPDIIIATETEVLESTASYFQNNDKWNGKIYGIGVTGKIASYIEKDIISAIVVQNEFNVGYLSVKGAVSAIKGERVKTADIDYKVVDSKNMYTKECQKLIFPFIR